MRSPVGAVTVARGENTPTLSCPPFMPARPVGQICLYCGGQEGPGAAVMVQCPKLGREHTGGWELTQNQPSSGRDPASPQHLPSTVHGLSPRNT